MTGRTDFKDLSEYQQWLRMYRLFRAYPMDEIREKAWPISTWSVPTHQAHAVTTLTNGRG